MSREATAVERESTGGLGRILIVEDASVVAVHLAAMLSSFGYIVIATAATGEDAVEKALSLVPDLVLMDIHLAGTIDGIQATALIKKAADIPVIYMSALSDEKTQRRANETGPHAYLVKPFAADELRCAIEIAVHRHEIGTRLKKRTRWLAKTLRSISAALGALGSKSEVAGPGSGAETPSALDHIIDQILNLVGDPSESAPGPMLDPVQTTQSTWLPPNPVVARGAVTVQHLAAEIRELNLSVERRVSERTEQLEAANRELDAFNSSVAHDLRAPLRGIDGFSQALIEEHASRLGEDGVGKLHRIRLAASRMTALIESLLRLSRISRSEIRKVPVSLSTIAATIAAELQAKYPERDVDFVIADGMTVLGDEPLVRIVVQNLLENAWKFSSRVEEAHIECGQVARDGTQISFVRDNGAGFDTARSQKLFGAFQRMHSELDFEGTGVGLAIVQRIIDRHGGLIWAESTVGQGTTFYFTL